MSIIDFFRNLILAIGMLIVILIACSTMVLLVYILELLIGMWVYAILIAIMIGMIIYIVEKYSL